MPQLLSYRKKLILGGAFAGLPATAYMYALQNAAQRYLEEEKVTHLCEPLFATTVGIVVLNERYNEYILLGELLIIAGMIASELKIQSQL